jgi:hypothetical protein
MPLSYKDLTRPIVEPVSLSAAKHQCNVADIFTDDDDLLTGYIIGARQTVEKLTNRAIYDRIMQLTMDYFPWPGWDSTVGAHRDFYMYAWYWRGLTIRLPKPGCLAVNSITYVDATGTLQTLDPSTYRVDLNSEPARIVLAPGTYWPYSQNYLPGSVCVNYTAGTHVRQVTETVTVPSVAPYVYTPLQATDYNPVTGIVSIAPTVESEASAAAATFSATTGQLTFPSACAGLVYTLTYNLGDCPHTIKQAMMLLVSDWYNNREASSAAALKEIPFGVMSLLAGEVFDSFDMVSGI